MDGGGSDGQGTSIDDAASAMAAVFCARSEVCLGTVFDVFGAYLLSGESCTDAISKQLDDTVVAAWRTAIDRGVATYDGVLVEQCIDEMANTGCELLQNVLPDVCVAAVEGTVGEGARCESSADCTGDRFCYFPTSTDCEGTCEARRGASGACQLDSDCESGMVCQDNSVCGTPASAAQSCDGTNPPCASGLVCRKSNADATTGTCASSESVFAAGEGDDCDIGATELCQPGLSCVVDSIVFATAAFKCASPSASGTPCKLGLPDPCPTGEFCIGVDLPSLDLDGECGPAPAQGQTCAHMSCAAGLVCIGGDPISGGGTCEVRQRLGGMCADATQCYSQTCVSGRCVAPETSTCE